MMPLQGFPTPIRVKIEPLSDIETEATCKICGRGFASEMALNNHVKVSHIEIYATGEPSNWTDTSPEPAEKKNALTVKPVSISKSLVNIKPEFLNKLSLCKDVNYIILKAAEPLDINDGSDKGRKRKCKTVVVRQRSNEKREKLTQPITGPFECSESSALGAGGVCHQMFFSCCEYSSHVRAEHSKRRKTHKCQVCERILPASGDGVACETCGEELNSPDDLPDHIRLHHMKPKRYECCICHKRFTQQAGVQQHMRMHTGDRPYCCTFCPKAFTQKSGLDQHLRTHTKHKPYKCVICSKTFCQSVHLKQHMRTHTNVAPFQCGICQKRFKQSSHLNYHLKNHNQATLTEEQQEQYRALVGELHMPERSDMRDRSDITEQCDMPEQSDMPEDTDMTNGADLTENADITEYADMADNEGVVYVEVAPEEYVLPA